QEGPPQPGEAACSPRLRMLPQWEPKPRWGPEPLHDKGATWQNSGCHPSSIAAVLRGIAEDNPASAGKFDFPTAADSKFPSDWYPPRMCEAFWPNLKGQVAAKGGKVDHAALREAAEKALGMPSGAAKVSLGKERLAAVKKALAKGPLVVCMPGHFVCIQGIEDGKVLIIDPGNVLANYWAVADGSEKGKPIETGKAMPDAKTGWKGSKAPGREATAAGYVRIPIDAKIFTPEPGPDAKKSQRSHWESSEYKTADKAKRFL